MATVLLSKTSEVFRKIPVGSSEADRLLRDIFEEFYGSAEYDGQQQVLDAASDYLHEKVDADGLFPDETDETDETDEP